MTLPGRGPKTPEERVADAIRSQPVNSGDGALHTRKANRRTPTAPLPESPAATRDRLTVYANIPVASMPGASGQYDIQLADWGLLVNEGGSSIGLGPSSGYDGIYVYEAGTYAVNVTLYVPGVTSATNAMMLQLSCNSGELNNTPTATWHGDDAISGNTPYATGSLTNHFDGEGLSGGLFPFFIYKNVDPSTTQVGVNVEVVRLS